MNDESWSDIELSRAMARRLLGRTASAAAERPVRADYTFLSASIALERRGLAVEPRTKGEVGIVGHAPAPPPGTEVLRAPPSPPPEESLLAFDVERLETLEMLLAWTRDCASAKATFLLDAQGFIIERAGKWEIDIAEATGAQVLLAIERLGSAELRTTSPRVLNVEYDDYWLTAIPIAAGHGETYTLCLVTGSALSPARLEHISKAVSAGIMHV